MKKSLSLFVIIVISLFIFSLSYADYGNYAQPQLEFISNAVPLLWDKPKSELLRIMSIFPDYECTDYGDQVGCVSIFNTNGRDNIFLNFFTDDYEKHHDNLWKVAVTADLQHESQQQTLLNLLWLDGMKPYRPEKADFTIKGALPLYFRNETTSMIIYTQDFEPDNTPFLLVEYFSGDVR